MDTFLQILIRFAFSQLICKDSAQIEQDSCVPVFEIGYLHFHVNLSPVFHQYAYIQNPQLVIRIVLVKYGGKQGCFCDCFRISF